METGILIYVLGVAFICLIGSIYFHRNSQRRKADEGFLLFKDRIPELFCFASTIVTIIVGFNLAVRMGVSYGLSADVTNLMTHDLYLYLVFVIIIIIYVCLKEMDLMFKRLWDTF